MSAPAGYTRLGVVGYSMKGAYNPTATYNQYNTVTYQGNTYYCKVDNTSSIAPTNTSYWGIVAEVPVATTSTPGKVKPDGTTVTIDNDGTIHASSSGHTIVDASGTTVPTEPAIQFVGANLSDDDTNHRTVVTVPIMTGATSQAAGASGEAPAPSAGDQEKVLKGNATWDNLDITEIEPTSGATEGQVVMVDSNGAFTVGDAPKGVIYGTSSTASATAAKVVTTTGGDFALYVGATVIIKFTNGNTADNPTINVDNTGAKAIYLNGTALEDELAENGVYQFSYNGTQFDLVGGAGGGGSASIVQIPVQDTSATYTYDGTVQHIAWTGTVDTANIVFTNDSATNAGTYTCTATLKNASAVWTDLTNAPKTFTWTIDKATGSITVAPTSTTLDADHLTKTIAVAWTGDGSVGVASSDTTVATVSPVSLNSAGNVTVTATQKTGTVTITATLAAGTNYTGATATCTVTCSFLVLKTFAAATEEEILQMVQAADAGQIDLYEDAGWRVGQERTVSLAAINASGTYDGASWSVGESQTAQTITLVLMHRGTIELVDSVLNKNGTTRTTCSFVVGVKNSLGTFGYMNSTNTNTGSWRDSARRGWCNGGFRQALPSNLRSAFKKFKCITGDSNSTATGAANITTQDYFALPAGKEVFNGGSSTSYSTDNEASALTQFTWYETTSNRIKTQGDNGSACNWWERSPGYSAATSFCYVNHNGTATYYGASGTYGLSPFGCL